MSTLNFDSSDIVGALDKLEPIEMDKLEYGVVRMTREGIVNA